MLTFEDKLKCLIINRKIIFTNYFMCKLKYI